MLSVHIVYGFTEGHWHGKRLRQALRDRGHEITDDITRANAVIAHSGACYIMAPLREEQLLLLVNPTYWPGRPINQRAVNMIKLIFAAIRPGNHFFYHINKLLHNTWYLMYHYRTSKFMVTHAENFDLEPVIEHIQTILVRNHTDPWLTPDLEGLKKHNKKLQIEHLPGEHDDLWLNPGPYVQLLEDYR